MLQALQQQDAVTGPQPHSTSNQQNTFQKNLSHQINTQRANHNPQALAGFATNAPNHHAGSSGQFASSKQGQHNLPLIRTESHDTKLQQ